MIITNGATLTIRSDTRIHSNAPASFTGSLSNVSFTGLGGEFFIDATKVRWLAYNSGSGLVPAIGTIVTQGAVTGYLLGVWSGLAAQPTAVGAAMPTSGFIKFREVTNGPFSSGALTNIGASATGPDVTGWIECAWDSLTDFTVGRVGKMKSRGDWFYLDNTNGTVGQTMQVPSTSSVATNNFCPGAWVETSPGSDEYEFWPGLASAAAGWSKTSLGYPEGFTDKRGQFVRAFGNGIIQFGESITSSGTYASLANQSGTYSAVAISATYIWDADVIYVNTGSTAHLLDTGQETGLQFTSGGGVSGIYTVTVIDAFNFSIPHVGYITGGNVTVRPGVTITFSAHGVNQGEDIYCDFTSGTGVDGTYKVYSVNSANSYTVSYPHTTAITGGNVSCLHTLTITNNSHGHAVGNEVYCEFTGGLLNGRYIIKAVAANTFNINYAHTSIINGNVTLKWTVGHVPPSGCKVRIPNILMSECATGSRQTNSVPNATIASRPEFVTSTSGAIDLEFIYALSLRSLFSQPYSCRLHNCALQESLNISECATALDINNIGIGQYSAINEIALNLTSNFFGGTVSNIIAKRANIASSGHSFQLTYCKNQTFTNIDTGIIQFARSSGTSCVISTCNNLKFNGLKVFNGNISISTSIDIEINYLDYNDRNIGRTNLTSPYYAIVINAGCEKIIVNNITFGLNNTIEDCHPYNGIINMVGASNIKIRNVGSSTDYLKTGIWAPNLYACGLVQGSTSGNNNNIKIQKVFVGRMRTGLITTINSDKNVIYEQVLSSYPWAHSAKSAFITLIASLNTYAKGIRSGNYPTAGQTAVYGTHFIDTFQGTRSGSIILIMNEPTVETAQYYTNDAGVVKFNSSGGVEMRSVGDITTWETPYYIQGHTWFLNTAPVMSGGTIGNYRFKYQIDLNDGNGWSALSGQLTGAELASELSSYSIDPVDGFKIRIQIQTITANTTAITYLRIYTSTSTSAQNSLNYPLDVVPVTITVKDINNQNPIENARVFIEAASGGPLPQGTDILTGLTNSNGIFAGETEYVNQPIFGRVRRASINYGTLYKSAAISSIIESDGLNLTVLMIPDE
jgi:hypothetical protein